MLLQSKLTTTTKNFYGFTGAINNRFAIYTPRQRILVIRTKGNLSSNTTFFDPFSAVERYHEETYHDFSSENETQGCELNALQCPETKNTH